MKQDKIYSAIDFLDKIFEFTEMTPNPSEWNLNALKSNPPRFIRLQQIDSLTKAFFDTDSNQTIVSKIKNIFKGKDTLTIHSILNGDFILARDISDYHELILLMEKVKDRNEDLSNITTGQLIMPYQNMLKYKREIRNLLTFNSGWLEANSIPVRYSIDLTNSISKNLLGTFSELDNVLELFISPKRLTFTEQELKEHYQYPSNDLREVDMDFY